MEKRLIAFMVLAFLCIMVNFWITSKFVKPPAPVLAEQKKTDGAAKPAAEKAGPGKKDADKPDAAKGEADKARRGRQGRHGGSARSLARVEEKLPEQWVTLGSADPASDYRMLVTLTNRGAAVERIELNSPRYRDVEDWEDRSGYLGQLEPTPAPDHKGLLLQCVGPGTPAALAGLKTGDVLIEVAGRRVHDAADLIIALKHTRPDEQMKLAALRDGKRVELTARLIRPPLSVVKPEGDDPLSFLLTLNQLDGQKIPEGSEELPGLTMRTGNWKLLPGKDPNQATFQWVLPEQGLEILKHFRLAQVPAKEQQDSNYPAYSLEFSIEIRNASKQPHTVAWRLDGPTGLPTEGSWYSFKISRNWTGGAGLRDVVVGFRNGAYLKHALVSCATIVDKPGETWDSQPLIYIGVDSQYFSSVLIPQSEDPNEVQFGREMPLRVGPVPADKAKKNQTDVSCRIIGKETTLAPGEAPAVQKFKIFAGPKKPELLAAYNLDDLVYYGMFGWVARPMLQILHFFYHYLVHNYGIAIIMLTVLVRSCMFPISRRQALNAQKMQELQPEIKRLAEKFKNNVEARTKAQQELFRKHNYNPLAGCLPVFLQLPIFLGLYRSLAVDVELRQAPLISESIRWCSEFKRPHPTCSGTGSRIFAGRARRCPQRLAWAVLLNALLPLITIGLFIWQQKMFMPPAADEQAAMQQKMMQYMMIFMSFMFFKVASGLCLYFIASSLWGIAERKLLPKTIIGSAGGGGAINVRSKLPSLPAATAAPTWTPGGSRRSRQTVSDRVRSDEDECMSDDA